MSQEDEPEPTGGLSLSDATEAVVAADESRDPEAMREVLEFVAEDGVVSRESVESAVAEASKVVATPETRVELASMALSDATDAAEPVADLDAVRSRLDGFEARLATVEGRVADLGGDLQGLLDRADDPEAVYEVASELRRITAEANDLQGAADDLALDLESFERWVDTAQSRYRELEADVDAVAEDLDGLADAIEEVGDDGLAWVEATFRHRVLGLLVADLRAELADLRTWADRDGRDDGGRADDLAGRLDDLEERRAAVGDRLDDLERPAWSEWVGDRLAAFERDLAAFEPPVDWGEVQATVDEHRAGIEESG